MGFGNILELCRNFNVQNFIYASSSSVYGGNHKVPFRENDPTEHPLNLYGATKLTSDKLFIAANNYRGNNNIKLSCSLAIL